MKELRLILTAAFGLGLVVNGCAWNPGYGGRRDGKPGIEVERYFGWPACFRAELWRSNRPLEVDIGAYILPGPLRSEMSFVSSSHAVLPLLLDLGLIASIAGICALFVRAGNQGRASNRVILAGVALGGISWLIVRFADRTSAFL